MQIQRRDKLRIASLLLLGLVVLFGYQNCGQSGSIASVPVANNASTGTPVPTPSPTPVPSPTPSPNADCANLAIKGTGTTLDPFQIDNEPLLKCFSKSASMTGNKSWILTKDLDLSSYPGSQVMIPFFRGTFDGQFHHIKNFHLNCNAEMDFCRTYKSLGIFGSADKSVIKNLHVDNVAIEMPAMTFNTPVYHVGGVIGLISDNSTLEKVNVSGTLNIGGDVNYDSLFGVGMLAGFASGSVINESKALATLRGNPTPYSIGALVGRSCQMEIKNSYAKGDVYGGWFVGGLAGGCGNGGSTNKFSNSYYIGNMTLEPGHWSDCSYVSPLGTAQGEPLNDGRTQIANSFWQGTASCSRILYQASAPAFSQAWVMDNFVVDANTWDIRSNDWPELKWIEAHP